MGPDRISTPPSVLLFLLLLAPACDPAPPPPPSPPLPNPQTLAGQIVAAHNRVRAAVDPAAVPPLPSLEWSEDLAQIARQWAAQCRFAHNPQLEDRQLGENLAAFTDVTGTIEKAVGGWAAEASDYDLAHNRCAPGAVCGHYTQLVWRDTRQVGCAVVDCDRNSPFPNFPRWQLWVCDYSPPGNWVGERPY